MAGQPRGALRSSARLNTGGGAARAAVDAARAAAESAARAAAAAQAAEAAAAAARRRARAAERALEVEDSPRELRDKCRLLARALRNAKHLVVYTGAGISTAADIPDYRGPRGVWTRLARGERPARVEVAAARPTLTHMALTALWARGTLKFVVSQNCDGLHLRAGLPRRALAELHGDMFAERCAACRRVYLRAFDTTERTARHAHATRRLCHACGAELADTIVHFGERGRAGWPLNWAGALRHAAAADVVLCLGSSLKVLRRYPRLWRMQRAPRDRPALYIVNLQWTPKDAAAALKINARCDAVMAQVARRLRLRVPRYRPRRDPLLAHAVPLAPPEQHTTRRRPLRAPSPACSRSAGSSCSPGESSDDSLSPSDSDDEVPLRRLAERLRSWPPPRSPLAPPPRPPLPPPPDLLHAFQVSMRAGEATILLRARDAPSVRAAAPGGPAAAPAPAPAARRALSDLRMFRMARRGPPLNGQAPPPAPAPAPRANAHLNGLLKPKPEIEQPKPAIKREGDFDFGPVVNNEPWAPVKSERDRETEVWPPVKSERDRETEVWPPVKSERDRETEVWPPVKSERDRETEVWPPVKSERDAGVAAQEASALAAAIIARAVLLCRASLYSGLHTILAPPAAPAPAAPPAAPPPPAPAQPAECAWCLRRYRARRCQWYGPPPGDVLAARVWRRARGRRYLCACCGDGRPPPAGPAPAGGDPDGEGDGGWYGKGYRKGRRRPRR